MRCWWCWWEMMIGHGYYDGRNDGRKREEGSVLEKGREGGGKGGCLGMSMVITKRKVGDACMVFFLFYSLMEGDDRRCVAGGF